MVAIIKLLTLSFEKRFTQLIMKAHFSLIYTLVLVFGYSNPIGAQKSSRLSAQSLYTFGTGKFNISDSTIYTYLSSKRGGDLNSRYLSYDRAENFVYSKSLGTIVKNWLSMQSFDLYENRELEQKSVFNLGIGAYENAELVFYYTTIKDTITSIVKQTWNSTTINWDYTSQQIFTHDVVGNRNSYTLQFWDKVNAKWLNNDRFIYSYDLSNNLIKSQYQTWSMTSSNWTNVFQDSNNYSSTNKITSSITQIWNTTSSVWQNNKKINYAYDASDFLIEGQELGWDAALSDWFQVKRYIYTNDPKGNVLTFLNQNWNKVKGDWDEFRKRAYTYDFKGNLLTNTWYYWNDLTTIFDNGTKETFTYDGKDNMLSQTSALWDKDINDWVNNERLSVAYNSYNQKTIEQNEVWDKIGNFWYFRSEEQKRYYYYQEFTNSLQQNSIENSNLKLYPIPAKDLLNISLKLNHVDHLNCQIIDLQGRVIKQWKIENTKEYFTTIPIQNLQSGSYILRISDSNNKFIQEKFQVCN
jgi:YD repeat-containing protein